MKTSAQRKGIRYGVLSAALLLGWSAFPAGAAEVQRVLPASNMVARVSDRLIIKLKPSAAVTAVGMDRVNAVAERALTAQELDQIKIASGLPMTEHSRISAGAHVMALQAAPSRAAMDSALAAIAKLPNVEYVEEDRIDVPQFVPNDTRYAAGQMWGMMPVSAAAAASSGVVGSYGADFQTAWDTSSGTGVVIAVVDSGITPHIDIGGPQALVTAGTGSNLVSDGYTFISDCRIRGTSAKGGCAATTATASAVVAPSAGALDTGDYITAQDVIANPTLFPAIANSSWHGTHVAGTIGAIGNNGISVIGGAYNAKLLPVRVIGKGGGYLSDIAEGLRWAAGVHPTISNPNPAKVINLSVGGLGPCSVTQQSAIDAVVAAGAVVVVAAGNENTDAATVHPASCNNVISVAAVAKDGRRAAYSNFTSGVSAAVTLAAPGGDMAIGTGTYDPGIVSTVNGSTTTPLTTIGVSYYGFMQGTSMAAPHVSAAAALMLARNPALTPAQIKSILSAPASVTAFPSFVAGLITADCATNNNCGAGVLNAALAVQNSLALVADVSPADLGSVTAGSTLKKTITFTNLSGAAVTISGNVSITGSNASLFTVSSSTCNAVTVNPNGTCLVTVQYAPTAAGSHQAMLTVPATLPTGVKLTGTATSAPAAASSGKSGGCAMVPGASPDVSLLLAMLAVLLYWSRQRIGRARHPH